MADETTEAIMSRLGFPGDWYDWDQAFAYCSGLSRSGDAAKPGESFGGVSDAPFDLADVERVEAAAEGENDAAEWLCLVLLKDGRWGFLAAGCDYTGWDCQASGESKVASDRDEMIRFGMTDNERERLKLALP